MNKYFTEKDIKYLQELNVIQYFDSVLDSQYKRGTTSKQDSAVAELYEKTTGNILNKNYSCKMCVFNIYKTVGTLYRQSLKYIEEQKKKKVETSAKKTNTATTKKTNKK